MKKCCKINNEINVKKIISKDMQKNNHYNYTKLNKNKNINETKYQLREKRENLIIYHDVVKKELRNNILPINESKYIRLFCLFNTIISLINLIARCNRGNFYIDNLKYF